MEKGRLKSITRTINNLFMDMEPDRYCQFELKYLQISLQRMRILNWVIFFMGFYCICLDYIVAHEYGVSGEYGRNLVILHISILFAAIVFILLCRYITVNFSHLINWARSIVLIEVAVIMSFSALLSLNSQLLYPNIDLYVMAVMATALIIPLYPKRVLVVYSVIHILFLLGLSQVSEGRRLLGSQVNATITIVTAIVLFMTLYRYNVENFFNEIRLKDNGKSFLKLFEMNPFPLFISSARNAEVLYANRRAQLFYDMEEGLPPGLRYTELYNNDDELAEHQCLLWQEERVSDCRAEQKTLKGEIKHAVINHELIDYMGQVAVLSGVVDISEIRRIETELAQYASIDPLTGVWNHRMGMEKLRERLAETKSGGAGFCLCFLDIDNLKHVNDTYGHLEGDALITSVCSAIREELGEGDVIFRYGGDEFIILFASGIKGRNEEFRSNMERRFDILNETSGKPYRIDSSLGNFCYHPEMDLNLEQIIEIADKEMYKNKLQKRRAMLEDDA